MQPTALVSPTSSASATLATSSLNLTQDQMATLTAQLKQYLVNANALPTPTIATASPTPAGQSPLGGATPIIMASVPVDASVLGAVSTASANIQYFTQTPVNVHAGDVIQIATNSARLGVEQTTGAYNTRQYGVVDHINNTLIQINTAGTDYANVSTENGPIQKGDYLTSSSLPGVAMKATRAGMSIGVAMEDFNGSNGTTVQLPPSSTTTTNASNSSSLNQSTASATLINSIGNALSNNQVKVGSMNISIRPQIALPIPDCDLSDVFCRTDYFDTLAPSTATSNPFNGYISSAFIDSLVVNNLQVKHVTVTDNAGTAMFPAGAEEITINNPNVTAQSLVQITFETDYAPATRIFVTNIIPNQSFTIKLNAPVANDAQLNWWIVSNTSSQAQITPIQPVFSPTPAATDAGTMITPTP